MKVLGPISRRLTIIVPYLWLAVLFLAPFLMVLKVSLSEPALAIPPYQPAFSFSAGLDGLFAAFKKLSFENYSFITGDALYWKSFLSSIWIALISTILALAVGFPLAYGMARAPHHLRPLLVMAIILPFWTSFLIRVYAWIGILKKEGLLNQLLLNLGVVSEPLTILNTNWAVFIGIIYSYLPFMVLPLYASLERQDESLLEAAADLGSTRIKAFWQITVPLAFPGIIAGSLLVFIPAVGEFVIPELLGGSETLMIGKTLWNEFFRNRDWPVASAVAIVMLIMLVVPIVWFQRVQTRNRELA